MGRSPWPAADFAAGSGGGIDLVHVYAYPLDVAAAPVFLGQASVTGARPDVAAYVGAQFGNVGFTLAAPALPVGRYQIVAYGRSLVSGTFGTTAVADITVR